eukprot:GDKI01019780.1.p2 GENE.GDKI01019780.1~~GDKI01019780.1.p2  ORF type:complete len:112 (-),score=8.53 GDKI01019780.1:42-377(-)
MDSTMHPATINRVHDTHWFVPVAATNRGHPGSAASASLLANVAPIRRNDANINVHPATKMYILLPDVKKLTIAFRNRRMLVFKSHEQLAPLHFRNMFPIFYLRATNQTTES